MTDQNRIVVGVPKETFPGERRVAIIPDVVPSLEKAGAEVWVESGAGIEAGYGDEGFSGKGAHLADRDEVLSKSDVVFQVRTYGANPELGKSDLTKLRKDQIVIGLTESLSEPALSKEFAETGATLFSLELLPRITRAQSMDVLSSMATIAGYKAVLLAADRLPKIFPMFMTAAGTVAPARVFVIGAGVAGLQAIATSKRLGAVVSAYDVRPAVKEQVQSLGGKFVELEIKAEESEDAGGYAKAMGEEFYKRQREMMTKVVAENDVVISTAAVPGKKAPILLTKEMVGAMSPGSVIVDLAAERGGNCELTRPGETVDVGGVTIMGPLNLPATIPTHASQMYSKNITTFFLNICKEGAITLDMEDEITRDTMVTKGGDVISPRIRELLGLSHTNAAEGR
ncbi:MAG: Re/Si-specific NAD(P)(+) transhydrogenase subunit alpha [Candidatus Krumholzibacteria bacterium]|nr:Re/Si-specific NAD(P)(+) transhydrogenase subunit alpha [Candidatus Krumholzibacteria bacterium]